MPRRSNDPQRLAALRGRASSRLTQGAGAKGPSARAADALSVLHALASSPATAADALALLHELQVHQVELDLQAEELRESRAELESALQRQVELYDFQPVGCFTVGRSLIVCELNRSGASMLGIGRDDVYGLPLDTFLAADSGRALRQLVSTIAAGAARATALLQLIAKDGQQRVVRAHVSADPAGQRFLLVLTDTDQDREAPSIT